MMFGWRPSLPRDLLLSYQRLFMARPASKIPSDEPTVDVPKNFWADCVDIPSEGEEKAGMWNK